MIDKEKSVFETLNAIDVSKNIEKKQNLSYLSWAWAWSTVKKAFPETTYKVYENEIGLNYHSDSKTAWVKVGVSIQEVEYIEYLPVMNYRNQSIQLDAITSMDVNKAIQRALTKAIARHGLGLYIYAGEDLPEQEVQQEQQKFNPPSKASKEERLEAWNAFKEICETMEVDATDFVESWGMEESKRYGEIRKFLKDEQVLRDQLLVFKNTKVL